MSNKIIINKTLKPFNKIIEIEGDKSLSIRCALLASQANGKSEIINLLKSEDVLHTVNSLRKLGINFRFNKNKCEIFGLGLNNYNYKKNMTLNTGNSGTLARLIIGLLIHSKEKIKIIGDKSLSKRDFFRVTKPLGKFGAKFKTHNGKLPIIIEGANNPKPINLIVLR